MDQETVDDFKRWFTNYVRTFDSNDSDQQWNMALKEKHSWGVCKEILRLGEKLGLSDDDLRLAGVMALFHDLGRFEQYAHYRTFSDRQSEDHAQLSVKALQENGVLDRLDEPTRDLILRAISYHNRINLPEDESEECLFFTKLLRDADKLDVMQLLIDYYRQKNRERKNSVELGLPDTPGISEEVCRDLMEGRMVKIGHLRNLNDFKLLQAGWVYDINFLPTFQAIRDRNFLELIQETMPQSEEVTEIFFLLRSHLDKRIRDSQEEI